jgi:transcriptional regulator with XRE-family HTH domain
MSEETVTIDEYLNSDENSQLVVEKIVDYFRETGEWGKRGLLKNIADKTGFTPAYIGRVLKGKQRITSDLLVAIMKAYNLDGIVTTVNWPGSYSTYDKVLSTYEILLLAAFEKADHIQEDDLLLESIIGAAYQVMNFSEKLQSHFNPNRLKIVKELASKVIAQSPKKDLSKAAV